MKADPEKVKAFRASLALDNGFSRSPASAMLLAEREAGKTMEVVGRQTDAILNAVSADSSPSGAEFADVERAATLTLFLCIVGVALLSFGRRLTRRTRPGEA